MVRPSFRSTARPARSAVAVLVYLASFVALLLFLLYYYLIPAMSAARDADPERRKVLAAHATLILALVLFVLLVGLLMTFRIGRFFRPASTARPKPTQYTDAWAESAKRMKMPEADKGTESAESGE